MRYEMKHEYQLDGCMNKSLCEPFIIDFPSDFQFRKLTVSTQGDSLIALCKCEVWIDGFLLYDGVVGDSIGLNLDTATHFKQLTIKTDCEVLKNLIGDLPPFKISITGDYVSYGDLTFTPDIQEDWC
tara:strand:+ start:167 stop:547 length:381 start_codon:yes stop_codon:yes gene_type:complete